MILVAIAKTFFDLAKSQVDLFQSDNITWMSIMATGWQIQEIMIMAYRNQVRKGILKQYEEIPEDVWQMVDEIGKGQQDPIIRERIAISLISLNHLL